MFRQSIALCSLLIIAACSKKASEPPAPESGPSYSPSDNAGKASTDKARTDTMATARPDTAMTARPDTSHPRADTMFNAHPDATGNPTATPPKDSTSMSNQASPSPSQGTPSYPAPGNSADTMAAHRPDTTWNSASSAVGAGPQTTIKVDPAMADRGKKIWKSKQCAGCHELGRQQSTGPDLIGVTDRRSQDWLERWLQDPVTMAQGDETAKALKKQYNAQMPKLGLSKDDADALISYLAQETQARHK